MANGSAGPGYAEPTQKPTPPLPMNGFTAEMRSATGGTSICSPASASEPASLLVPCSAGESLEQAVGTKQAAHKPASRGPRSASAPISLPTDDSRGSGVIPG